MKKVGAGTVEKRGKDCWRIRVSVVHDDGTPERLSKTVRCRTKTEAKHILDAWRTELMTQGGDVRRKGMTVREYLLEHVAYCRDVEQLSPTTVRGYRNIVDTRFTGEFGEIPLVDLKPFMIEEHYAQLRTNGGMGGKPLSGKTVASAASFLSTALKRAVALELLPSNPCDRVKAPSMSKPKTNVLSKDEVRRMLTLLIGHPDQRFAMACRLALATGMRRGEVCGLVWDDVNLDGGAIHVANALVQVSAEDAIDGNRIRLKPTKTDASERTIAIDALTLQWLRLHRELQHYRLLYFGVEQLGSTPVFAGALGEWYRPDDFTKDFESFRSQHHFDIRLHDLRHSQASLLIEAGEDIVTIAKRLGHARVSTTLDIYSHLMPGKDRGAADKIGQIFQSDPAA